MRTAHEDVQSLFSQKAKQRSLRSFARCGIVGDSIKVGNGEAKIRNIRKLTHQCCEPAVKETMVKLGMDPTSGLASADVAKAYVAAIEGSHQGVILDLANSENSRREALGVRGPRHTHYKVTPSRARR